ncbi:MAG TPA: alpha-amylase family glycosyl hydrolase, partial [Acidobacteriota bacterium]|nr:alpha-amylase family glycosyl hydrolase [Acidobacteriota bacterium]
MRLRGYFKFAFFAFSVFLVVACSAHSPGQNAQGSRAGAPEPQWQNDWSYGAVFYEVFVRSFYDSNGDGIGDLKGLISKLDYLNDGNPATNSDLQVDALWLMPVFKSPSYHGYDTTDYRQINPQYGTNDDFMRLCKEAHKRGIKIIVDFVMNHSSSDHPWFIDSASSPQSSKRDWYVWNPMNPGWTQPWGGNNPTWYFKNGAYYYGVFWSGMPDLNFRNPDVRKMFRDTATFWLQRGADGFRLDATRYLVEDGAGPGQADTPETHADLKEFAAHIRRVKPQATLVGENWTDTPVIATYFGSTATVAGGDQLPMNFDFPLSSAIVDGVKSGAAQGIVSKLAEILSVYPQGVNDAPFLTNHDQVRLATVLSNNMDQLKNAAAILLTLPGAPFLYYGEEVGLQNGPTQGDESKRTPMPWNHEPGGGFTTASSPWFPFA